MRERLNILFATDFSLGSKIALKTLKLLQRKYQNNVSWIHVVESFWKDWVNSGAYQKEAAQRLESWCNKYSNGNKKNLYVKAGNPADIILDVSHKIKANLILMGGKITEESSRYKSGTAVESVVRFSTRSVWICQRAKISKILCGIDGSPSSAKALEFAIDLSKRFSAKLCIIHAIPGYLPAFGMTERTIRQEEDKLKLEDTDKMKKFLDAFDLSKIKTEIHFQWGASANVILDHAEDFDYDLIVIGAKGHSLLHHVLIGSTVEKILRYAPCSMLVVR
ncbi:Putative universal stress protein [Aquicella siphonis]|uniref:Universal stress protein n=1 Tax=Aquicella siphonis TaxID=254247 RepID=A0A5E4PJ90_9COXI|nr:universal stress protein [Aquicella siphonis]VVC77139.1 Putative universal stress protein [Aquicella siphonis]